MNIKLVTKCGVVSKLLIFSRLGKVNIIPPKLIPPKHHGIYERNQIRDSQLGLTQVSCSQKCNSRKVRQNIRVCCHSPFSVPLLRAFAEEFPCAFLNLLTCKGGSLVWCLMANKLKVEDLSHPTGGEHVIGKSLL